MTIFFHSLREKLRNHPTAGKVTAVILWVAGVLFLVGALFHKTQNYFLLFFLSGWIYAALCLWFSYQPNRPDWLIPWLSILVVLLPLDRFLLGAGGGPTTWDEMLYMNLAKNASADPLVLNQYFHIYILKIFYWLTNTSSFDAVRYYWIVTQSVTMILIHSAIQLLTREYRPAVRVLSSLLGLILFVAQPRVMENIGVAYVDFTLELLFAAAAFLVILAESRPAARPAVLALLGLLFGFGLRTKEVAVVLLLPALAIILRERRSAAKSKPLLRLIGTFLAGWIGAAAIFLLLNTLILHDPLWGFRPIDFARWYALRTGYDPGLKPLIRDNSFSTLFVSASGICLVLIGFVLLSRPSPAWRRIYRCLLALVLAFILAYLVIPFQAYDRYLIPLYPLLAILAAPAVATLTGGKTPALFRFLVGGAVGGALYLAAQTFWLSGLDAYIYPRDTLFGALILPGVLGIIGLLCVIWSDRQSSAFIFCLSLTVCFGLAHPCFDHFHALATREVDQQVAQRFKIIRQWAPNVQAYPDRLIFASNKLKNPDGPMSASADYTRIMLNLALDANLPTASVTWDTGDFLRGDLDRYCVGAMPTTEYRDLSEEQKSLVQQHFSLDMSKNEQQVFLTNFHCR